MSSPVGRSRSMPFRLFSRAPRIRSASAAEAGGGDGHGEAGEVRGMVAAIVRGRTWFLSSFWVLPAHQGRGIGRPLLERALGYGRERGARVRAVWASLDARAQARYLSAGLAPRFPIYRME